MVEAPQVLTIEEEEEESSTIFSPHFSDPLLCSINRPSSTIVSVRYIHACTVDIGQPLYSNNIQFKKSKKYENFQYLLELLGKKDFYENMKILGEFVPEAIG